MQSLVTRPVCRQRDWERFFIKSPSELVWPLGLDHPARSLTGDYLKTRLSINITKRGSWGTNGHRLGIVSIKRKQIATSSTVGL